MENINSREYAQDKITQCGAMLQEFPDFQNDDALVLLAVQNYGLALEFASEDLKKNPEIVNAAVNQNPMALEYADESFKNNKAFVLNVVARDGATIQCLSPDLQSDKEVALTAIQNDGRVCTILLPILKNDISFIWDVWRLQTCQNCDGSRLYFVSRAFIIDALKALVGALFVAAGIALGLSAPLISLPLLATIVLASVLGAQGALALAQVLTPHVYAFFKAPVGEVNQPEMVLNPQL